MDEAMMNEVNEVADPAALKQDQDPAGPDFSVQQDAPNLQGDLEADFDRVPESPELTPPSAVDSPAPPDPLSQENEAESAGQMEPPAEAYTPAVSRPVPAEFEAFVPSEPKEEAKLGMLMDVALNVTVELGRTRIPVREVLDLQSGSVIELEREAGEVVDIFVNEHLIAKGEVVVVDDKYGIRITEFLKNERVAGVE